MEQPLPCLGAQPNDLRNFDILDFILLCVLGLFFSVIFALFLIVLAEVPWSSLYHGLKKLTIPVHNGQANQTPQSNRPTVEVVVIPVPGPNDTASSAIYNGLVRLSRAMKTINKISTAEATPGATDMTDTMAAVVINLVNIMATVPDRDKPHKILPHHLYATRTAIASFLTLRTLVVKCLPEPIYESEYEFDATNVLNDTFSACVYFGVAILDKRAPYSAYLASSIGVEVQNISSQTSTLLPHQASILAERMMRATTEQIIPPPPTDIRSLVSIFTSDQLAGLARKMAYHMEMGGKGDPDYAASMIARVLLDLKVDVPPQFCPCMENPQNFPICLCDFKPISEELYKMLSSRNLLPGI
ncbi:hypothetical protein V8F33_013767 [Rhypophila sp. PSN 637]